MTGMFIGPLIYLAIPGSLSVAGAVEVSLAAMTLLVIPALVVFIDDLVERRGERSRGFILVVTAMTVIVDEIMMSVAFNLVMDQEGYLEMLHSNPLGFIWSAISSYWFVFPMALEMLVTIVFMWKELKANAKVVLVVQAALMFLAPTALSSRIWSLATIYISGALMTAFFVYMFEYLYRKQSIKGSLSSYLLLLLLVYGMMMGGIFALLSIRSYALIAIAMVSDMIVYLSASLGPNPLSSGRSRYWIASRTWSFLFLLLVFVAEFFMGAAFDLSYYGSTAFLQSIGLVEFSGSPLSYPGTAFYDFFTFFAHVSLSSWFLVMMGIEMGSLVVFKIRTTRELETRIRLGLMLAAYAVYSIYLPSFLLSNPSSIPFIGWSMGIGSGGSFSLIFLIPILLTYLISGILSYY
ncbi:4Fe-4S ferredoxin iron-sulfur binding domain-containing protein, partial [mine drainage metagenome]